MPTENPNYNPMTGNPWQYDPNSPWSEFEQNWGFHFFDNFANGGVLYQNLNPGEAQYSEWSQQMVSTMYQNWYNSAPEQMKRALQAGINPFVAASGISGGGSGSVAPAPAGSNTASLPSLIGSAAQGMSSLGSTFGNIAAGVATLSKLQPEIRKIDSETSNIFEQMGFTKLQSTAMSVQLKYLDDKEQIAVWQALASFDKTKAEYQNLLATHRNIIAQFDEIIAHKDLLVQEKGEVAAREEYEKAMKSKIEAETSWQNIENQFFAAHGYKLGTPLFEGLRDMMISNGTFDMNSFGQTVAGYNGKIASAVEHAKAQESWNYRPSNATEAVIFAGTTLGTALRDLIFSSNDVTNWQQLSTKLRLNAAASREFDQSFSEARENLYEEYLSKKRFYRNIRRGGNSQEVARAKMAMDNAYKEYSSLTKEKFGNQLLSELSKLN